MSVVLNVYKDEVDYTWYDSSNILYSECYDKNNDLKSLKVVFKGGRSYLYEKINVNDYLLFRSDLSQGKALNKYIIKYASVRLPDTDLEELENSRKLIIESRNQVSEDDVNTIYHIQYDDSNGNIKLLFEDKTIFEGVENNISLFKLLKALNIKTTIVNVELQNFESNE